MSQKLEALKAKLADVVDVVKGIIINFLINLVIDGLTRIWSK